MTKEEIERALKWYCLDCSCNDGCAAHGKCFFRNAFELYLEGNDKALPPESDYEHRQFGRFKDKVVKDLKRIMSSEPYRIHPDTIDGIIKEMQECSLTTEIE